MKENQEIKITVKLTFFEDVLGTSPNNADLLGTYIASKAPDARTMQEEIEAIGEDAVKERGMTVFPKLEDGTPYIYDYQVKGFLKDTAAALKKVPGTVCSKVKAFKKEIDGLVFVLPRKIPYDLGSGEMGICQRPLRASTPMGERVSIACSETVPAGSSVTLTFLCLTEQMADLVREALDYGKLRGFGQWRNAGYGRFTWEEISG